MQPLDRSLVRRIVRSAPALAAIVATLAAARSPLPSDVAAQQAHAQGTCGQLAPGTGLKDGKGWVASMMPGKHEFRVRGGGEVYLTAARVKSTLDFDVGRLYTISVEHAPAGAVLEWRNAGTDWAPVAKTFLYPPTQ
jgi:hypothetical protein